MTAIEIGDVVSKLGTAQIARGEELNSHVIAVVYSAEYRTLYLANGTTIEGRFDSTVFVEEVGA